MFSVPRNERGGEGNQEEAEEVTEALRQELSNYIKEIGPEIKQLSDDSDELLDNPEKFKHEKNLKTLMLLVQRLGRHQSVPERYKQRFRMLELMNLRRRQSRAIYVSMVKETVEILNDLLTTEAMYALQEHYESIFIAPLEANNQRNNKQ